MKKTLTTTLMALILCVCMIFSLTACGGFTQDDIDSAVDEATAPLNEQITALKAEIAEKAAKITAIEGEKTALTAEKTELLADIEKIEAEVAKLETEKATLEADIAALADRVAALEDKKQKLEEEKAKLEICLKGLHELQNNVCNLCGEIDATEMTANELNATVAAELAAGKTDVVIALAADVPAETFTAIRRALIETEGVKDGSINLTLKGVTAIPKHFDSALDGPAIFGAVDRDENGEYLEDMEIVTQLASINLPDVTSIGEQAFKDCDYLTSVTAPKALTIGKYAFSSSALTSVELPKATTIETEAFFGCFYITEIKLPKATVLGYRALDVQSPNSEVTIYLTSDSDIAVDKNCWFNTNYSGHLSTKVSLVLHANKQSQVSENTWTTKNADDKEVSFTFKSITFVGE